MAHKFKVGSDVYYAPSHASAAARGRYTVIRHLPVENGNTLSYRIKSKAETFERTADEHQLSVNE